MKALYKQGADAVILEMITQKEFDKRMEKYKGVWNSKHTGLKITQSTKLTLRSGGGKQKPEKNMRRNGDTNIASSIGIG